MSNLNNMNDNFSKEWVLSTINQKVNPLEQRIVKLDNHIVELKAENAELKAENLVLNTRITVLEAENAELKVQVAQLEKRLANVERVAQVWVAEKMEMLYGDDWLDTVTSPEYEEHRQSKPAKEFSATADMVQELGFSTGKKHNLSIGQLAINKLGAFVNSVYQSLTGNKPRQLYNRSQYLDGYETDIALLSLIAVFCEAFPNQYGDKETKFKSVYNL